MRSIATGSIYRHVPIQGRRLKDDEGLGFWKTRKGPCKFGPLHVLGTDLCLTEKSLTKDDKGLGRKQTLISGQHEEGGPLAKQEHTLGLGGNPNVLLRENACTRQTNCSLGHCVHRSS